MYAVDYQKPNSRRRALLAKPGEAACRRTEPRRSDGCASRSLNVVDLPHPDLAVPARKVSDRHRRNDAARQVAAPSREARSPLVSLAEGTGDRQVRNMGTSAAPRQQRSGSGLASAVVG
jgi:hypothetical protein